MRIELICLLIIGISLQFANAFPSEAELMKREEALEYLLAEREANEADFIKRSLTRTGPEQRREAKEKFEEKCERGRLTKTVNKFTQGSKKARWCPELSE